MNKYIVKVSKSIEGSFIVEAESEEDALDMVPSMNTLYEVSDSGWDVSWDASLLEGDVPTPLSADSLREIGQGLLP